MFCSEQHSFPGFCVYNRSFSDLVIFNRCAWERNHVNFVCGLWMLVSGYLLVEVDDSQKMTASICWSGGACLIVLPPSAELVDCSPSLCRVG